MRNRMLIPFGTLLLATAATAASAEETRPEELFGAWDVEKVAVDARDKPHWKVTPDDPQLMGRELVIDGEQVHLNSAPSLGCKPADWDKHATDWKSLFGSALFRSPSSSRAEPTPGDYGFTRLPSKPIAYSFCAHPPPEHRERWVLGPWLVALGPARLILHYDNQTVLVLARRPPDAKPRPSFACFKAATPPEKAICGSVALAAWDRSVALAWRRATEGGATPEQIQDQKEWLRIRDACGADATCLETRMRLRAAELSYGQ
jgi:hypothetical protein